jgi:hypothetical protein
MLVSPGASHAVRNEDMNMLWLIALSSESYDPAESVMRKVVRALSPAFAARRTACPEMSLFFISNACSWLC